MIVSIQALLLIIFRLSALTGRGNIAWSTGSLGSSVISSQFNDGAVMYTGNESEIVPNPNYIENPPPGTPYIPQETSSGRYFVGTVSADGEKRDRAFTVEGQVSAIYASRETGNCLICHGKDRVSEYNAQGGLVAEKTIPDTGGVLTPKGIAGPHGVLLNDKDGLNAYAFDMETGKLTKLTESEDDYSYKVITKEMEKEDAEAPDESGQEVDDLGDFISIDGIRLRKK